MKVAVGMSGGVDSTVAALLLKEQGHDVVGVTMTLGRADEARLLAEARSAAERLDVPLEVFDFAAAWRANVLRYVRETYLGGRTPNPCVRCNETVKFGLLPQAAFDLGCDRFATGHYARLEGGRLLRGVDRGKDQSYFLYRVPRRILERTLLPLGGLTKAAVREKARAFGLEVAERSDSQDFCGGDPVALLGTPPREGDIVTADGKVLGRHPGHWNYTVGKRKGLGIGGGTPYYVIGLDAVRNEVVVGFREAAVRRTFEIADLVTLGDGWTDGLRVKVRSAGEPKGPVSVAVAADGRTATVTCPDGLTGVAPGQSAVFYDGDVLVGGGIIAAS